MHWYSQIVTFDLKQVFYIIDTLFDVSCKIQHIPKGEMKRYVSVLRLYFEQFGGLVMMGGDIDASSKGIAGIHIADNDAYLLVIVRINMKFCI